MPTSSSTPLFAEALKTQGYAFGVGDAELAIVDGADLDIAALSPALAIAAIGTCDWHLTAQLFDAGFIACGTGEIGGRPCRVYLRSDCFKTPSAAGGPCRGRVSMVTLGTNGRFGNQLHQYAFLRLYGLRHELSVEVPPWIGNSLYGLADAPPSGWLPPFKFLPFDDDDLALWYENDPPIDVDFFGYFVERPACWAPHREFLRRLFSPPATCRDAVDRWVATITDHGRRQLIACHIRRGDYMTYNPEVLPWFRPVPLDWFATWIEAQRRGAPEAAVYVTTDDPEAVLPELAAFSPLSARDAPSQTLPPDVVDFEMLRRADRLAIVNSTFSRWAAFLASDTQAGFAPDFKTATIEPYDAWNDPSYLRRYGTARRALHGEGVSREAARHRSITLRREIASLSAELRSLKQKTSGR